MEEDYLKAASKRAMEQAERYCWDPLSAQIMVEISEALMFAALTERNLSLGD
ncbi:hypothetical protein [Noviherbaspirillum sp.]|uniref:hypothetical protein n=1 Tax=Noviherbaspirillum sp. TaxID=1926288 RepID=UPI002B481E67|nr:hypothetical protein [Noviherbaspirillum sp.]HJV83675.1 hypothetical protein [Noviherbaspirillum sp.]